MNSSAVKEMVGDKVTLEVTEVIEHYGETLVRGRRGGRMSRNVQPAREAAIAVSLRDPQIRGS
jgi:hypothetical protein